VKPLNEAHLLEAFLESLLAERGLSKNTVSSYFNDLQHLLLYFNMKRISLLTLSYAHLSDYFSHAFFDGKKRNTKARKISAIKQFYLFLLSERYITSNPAAELQAPKNAAQLPKALSAEQVEKLLDIATQMAQNSSEALRDACILHLLYSTGMRISEVLALTIEELAHPAEITAEHCVLNILGKGGKYRPVIVNHIALKMLHDYMQTRTNQGDFHQSNPYIFASRQRNNRKGHLSRQMFFLTLKQMAIQANIDPGLVSPHKIRHSFASHILHNGANLKIVQELLGHSSIASTQIYTKVLSQQAKDLVMQKHPLAEI